MDEIPISLYNNSYLFSLLLEQISLIFVEETVKLFVL